MATVISNTPAAQTSDSAAAGWAVAVVVLVAVLLVALFVWPGYVRPAAVQSTPGTNINVTLPSSDTTGTGGNAAGTDSTNSGGTSGNTTGTGQTGATTQ